MKFDRKKFFDSYRERFGKLSPLQVKGLSELLNFIEADRHITKLPYVSYIFATVKRETDSTFHPIHEYGGKAYFVRRYGGQTRKGKELGNDTPEEGYYYAGKGYPQTTGESNYEKAEVAIRREYPEIVKDFEKRTGKHFDLTVGDQPNDESDPANMMDPAIAYATMSYGMRKGMFTGHKFSDHLDETPPNYKEARRIINGTDHWIEIAADAKKFEQVLRDSKLSAASSIVDQTSSRDLPNNAALPTAHEQPPSDFTEGERPANGSSTVTAEITPEGGVKVETKDGATEQQRIAVVKASPQKWSSRVAAKITGVVTGNALFQWIWGQVEKLQGLEVHDTVWIVVSITIALGSLLWIIHEIVDTWRQNRNQERIDDLLVKENSTANNLVQLIPSDELELYRARGFKIITRGEKV
jgi:putative chitinase